MIWRTAHRISACINILHMRLGDAKENKSQSVCQQKLAEYKLKHESQQQYKGRFDGPFFVEDMSDDDECDHQCFINGHIIMELDGEFWHTDFETLILDVE